jgi:hypothetical protein
VPETADLSLRQIGRYNGLTDWSQSWDYLRIVGENSSVWDFDFDEGVGDLVSGMGSVSGHINSFQPESWQRCLPAAPVPPPIQIVAFTGQSNTLGAPRNLAPYDIVSLPALFRYNGQATTTVSAQVTDGGKLGGNWKFAEQLDAQAWNDGDFAFLTTGDGGPPSDEWNPGYPTPYRLDEFKTSLDALISEIEAANPGRTARLHSVVIQQGEKEAGTGQVWASDWRLFCGHIRAAYGSQIDYYVVANNEFQSSVRIFTEQVKASQLELCTTTTSPYYVERAFYVDPDGVNSHIGDNLHYSAAGYDGVGVRIFNVFAARNGLSRIDDPWPR